MHYAVRINHRVHKTRDCCDCCSNMLLQSETQVTSLFEEYQYRQYKSTDDCQPHRPVGESPTQFLIAEIFVAVAESHPNIHGLFTLHDGHRLLLALTLLIVREIITGATSKHRVLVVILSLLIQTL